MHKLALRSPDDPFLHWRCSCALSFVPRFVRRDWGDWGARLAKRLVPELSTPHVAHEKQEGGEWEGRESSLEQWHGVVHAAPRRRGARFLPCAALRSQKAAAREAAARARRDARRLPARVAAQADFSFGAGTPIQGWRWVCVQRERLPQTGQAVLSAASASGPGDLRHDVVWPGVTPAIGVSRLRAES